jgi:hypothetical protein
MPNMIASEPSGTGAVILVAGPVAAAGDGDEVDAGVAVPVTAGYGPVRLLSWLPGLRLAAAARPGGVCFWAVRCYRAAPAR